MQGNQIAQMQKGLKEGADPSCSTTTKPKTGLLLFWYHGRKKRSALPQFTG